MISSIIHIIEFPLHFLIPFLFVITIIIFFHELGHFVTARLCGIRVDIFSIGFGKEIIGFTDRYGTRWKICLVPLGGYVKFYGDADLLSAPQCDADEKEEESAESLEEGKNKDNVGTFYSTRWWKRLLVACAGPVANFILTFVLFFFLMWTVGKVVLDPIVDVVVNHSPAQEAGVKPGDKIISADGHTIYSFGQLAKFVKKNGQHPIDFYILRQNSIIHLKLTPRIEKGKPVLGVARNLSMDGKTHYARVGFLKSLSNAAVRTSFITKETLHFLWRLIVYHKGITQLGGPIRVAQVSGQVASLGLYSLIEMIAVLSISVGIINILPIPMLDGGHALFCCIESVFGRSYLYQRIQEWSLRVGMVLILFLFVFTTINDLVQVGFVTFIKNIF